MSESSEVRPGEPGDVDDMVELAARRRDQYRSYQPQFWRPADDAREQQRRFFAELVTDDAVVVLVAPDPGGGTGADGGVRGFAIARIVPAPPVYDPGGLTCLVDDFTVRSDAGWPEVGPALLEAVTAWAARRGAAQTVVVTAYRDEAKRAVLATSGLSLASEWWVGSVPGAGQHP